jgi:hypothetical protein
MELGINRIGIASFQYDVPHLDDATIYDTAGKATDDNMTHAHCMLVAKGYKYTLTIRNTYCCFTAAMVVSQCYVIRTCLSGFEKFGLQFLIFSRQFCAFIQSSYKN